MFLFNLSPGITPLVTCVAIFGFAISFGLSALVERRYSVSVSLILGLNGFVFSSFKIYTDFFDVWDVMLSLLVVAESVILVISVQKLSLRTPSIGVIQIICLLGVAFSIYKIAYDFLDPYDLLQACIGVLAGVAVLTRNEKARP